MSLPSQASRAQQQAQMVQAVHTALEQLMIIADRHEGMLPSVMNIHTGETFDLPPAPIPGQRQGDRARWGCNLMHDIPLLQAILQLGQVSGKRDYVHMVDRYLSRFVQCCTDTPSGLFAWGEHAYWRLDQNRIGNSNAETGNDPTYPVIHDHLRAVPIWLWEKLDALNPDCVQRFAYGLDYHFKSGKPIEFSRHACLLASDPNLPNHKGYESSGRPKRLTSSQDGANDFPRHSGFFTMDIAFAWTRSGDATLMPMLHRAADYWWQKHDEFGVLPLQSRGPECPRLSTQTLSLANSLLHAAMLLETGPFTDTALAAELRHRATHYIDLCYIENGSDDWQSVMQYKGEIWGGSYGHQGLVLCRYPNYFLGLYRLTGLSHLLDTAIELTYKIASIPIPTSTHRHIPAMDAAMALASMVDLYEITQEHVWLDHAFRLGQQILHLYFQHNLPIGATGINWYEAQLGSSYLICAMARLYSITLVSGKSSITSEYTN